MTQVTAVIGEGVQVGELLQIRPSVVDIQKGPREFAVELKNLFGRDALRGTFLFQEIHSLGVQLERPNAVSFGGIDNIVDARPGSAVKFAVYECSARIDRSVAPCGCGQNAPIFGMSRDSLFEEGVNLGGAVELFQGRAGEFDRTPEGRGDRPGRENPWPEDVVRVKIERVFGNHLFTGRDGIDFICRGILRCHSRISGGGRLLAEEAFRTVRHCKEDEQKGKRNCRRTELEYHDSACGVVSHHFRGYFGCFRHFNKKTGTIPVAFFIPPMFCMPGRWHSRNSSPLVRLPSASFCCGRMGCI